MTFSIRDAVRSVGRPSGRGVLNGSRTSSPKRVSGETRRFWRGTHRVDLSGITASIQRVFLLGQTGEPDPHKLISLAAIVPLSEVGLFISGDRERDLEAREAVPCFCDGQEVVR